MYFPHSIFLISQGKKKNQKLLDSCKVVFTSKRVNQNGITVSLPPSHGAKFESFIFIKANVLKMKPKLFLWGMTV